LHGHDITGLLYDQPGFYVGVPDAVDAVVVPSRFLAASSERAGFDAEKTHVIPSGVDTEFFTPTPLPSGPPTVAFVGRLVAKKGLDVLLAAWPRVRADVPAARLVVLGSGEDARLLDGTDDSITHIKPDPAKRHAQVRDLIRTAHVVVSPSRTSPTGDSESLLLVNLEAAASGRPVVSTRHGGIPEYVEDGRNGLLVAEGDPDELAEAIIRVLSDAALAERLGTAGVAHAAQWDVRSCAARVDDLYDALLERRRK
jgi:glycosyltransferase involved in cell wall biosynthesis